MGRIHDALKKAEEERARKRAAKENAPVAEETKPQSAAPLKQTPQEPQETRDRATQTMDFSGSERTEPEVPEPTKAMPNANLDLTSPPKKAKKGIAASLARARTEKQDRQPETPKTSAKDLRQPETLKAEKATLREASGQAFGELLLSYLAPNEQCSEQIRALRSNLTVLASQPRVISITSAVADEGTMLICANLAVALAEDPDVRVLVVDGNLRDSNIDEYFRNIDIQAGLTEVLAGKADPARIPLETGIANVSCVPAGGGTANPGALLASNAFAAALSVWREIYDFVLVAAPPVTEANDSASIGRAVDGVIMAVKLSSTPRKLTERSIDVLASSGTRVLGCVLTNSDAVQSTDLS